MAEPGAGSYESDGVVERWSWDGGTYTATRSVGGQVVARIALTVAEEVRLHAEAGGWVLRAGTVGPDVLWRRGEDEHEAAADGLTGPSRAYDVVLARRLHLEVGGTRRLRLLAVTEPVLATRLVDEQWTRVADVRWEVADLATGERRTVDLDTGVTGFMA